MRWKWIFVAPLAVLAMLALMFIGTEAVQHLWNWLLPGLFGWRQITLWQALGILVLCRILFGHHGWRGHGRPNFRQRMKERCGRMTPEEREKFRQAMRERWDFGPSPSSSESKGQ